VIAGIPQRKPPGFVFMTRPGGFCMRLSWLFTPHIIEPKTFSVYIILFNSDQISRFRSRERKTMERQLLFVGYS